ncbi:MAG TPA: gliding motility lipoprotein GldB, partial [Flavobacteriales bacterium]|nr:gliding motility lipoprotein GldB [Flavobacteriales bacterium]
YTTDQMEIRKFCDESPFTSGLPQNSPGRVGNWLGWMIVRAYMKDHPELKLPDLLDEKNERKILKSYKPPKE